MDRCIVLWTWERDIVTSGIVLNLRRSGNGHWSGLGAFESLASALAAK